MVLVIYKIINIILRGKNIYKIITLINILN